MLRMVVFALLVAAASAKYSHLGVVEGITSCGSAGQKLEVRVTDCTVLPCQLYVEKTYEIEVDFIPSVEHTELNVTVTAFSGGINVDILKTTVPAVVSPGNAYTLNYPWTVHDDHGFGYIALRIQLDGDGVVELCGLATANINPPAISTKRFV